MTFYTELDEMYGGVDAITDLRVVVRKLWFYDFVDAPTYLWAGQGMLHTADDNEWLGTMTADGNDLHVTPNLMDGRDGSSATYRFSIRIPQMVGEDQYELYESLKADQSKAVGRDITCYLALFKEGEALRPSTPVVFFKRVTMFGPVFREEIVPGREAGSIEKNYVVEISAKDGNFGRSARPAGTYADAIQKQRAAQKGVALDRGSEFLAALANRTYVIP